MRAPREIERSNISVRSLWIFLKQSRVIRTRRTIALFIIRAKIVQRDRRQTVVGMLFDKLINGRAKLRAQTQTPVTFTNIIERLRVHIRIFSADALQNTDRVF